MTKVTYICCSAKKKVVTYSVLFLFLFLLFIDLFQRVFWAFCNNGSSKTRKQKIPKQSIWAHHKKCGGVFSFFSPSVVWYDFFIAFLGVSYQGEFKKAIKQIARKSPQLPKKALTHLRHFFVCFRGAPCIDGHQMM
jgi:hypothetical protein